MNAREQSPSAQFAALVARFPAQTVALVKKCLPKLRRDFPVTHEIVYDYSHSVVVSFSMSERGYEAIVALAIFPRELKLYFDKSIPDPKGLLRGTGGKVRSVTIKAASELDHGDLHELVQGAIKHSGVTFPKTRSTVMIIKPESKKKKNAKPETKKRSSKAEPKKPKTKKTGKT